MSAAAGLVILAGRVLMAIFAVRSGLAHVRLAEMFEGGARAAGFPVPVLGGRPAGIWLIVAGLSLAFGVWPDVGALMVAAFVIVAAAWFHRYWQAGDEQKRMQDQLFWRNAVALSNSLVMFGAFAAFGPALRFSITAPLFQF